MLPKCALTPNFHLVNMPAISDTLARADCRIAADTIGTIVQAPFT